MMNVKGTTGARPTWRQAYATVAVAALSLGPASGTFAKNTETKSDLVKIQATSTGNAPVKQSIGGSERVDFSGRLHMLSQRIAASACMWKSNQDPDISRGLVAGSASEVDRILDALEFGNARVKIVGAETRKRTLETIHSFRTQWAPVRDAINVMMESGVTDEHMATIETANIPLLETATLLVSEISGQYSDPAELLQVDAIMVDISGRQRMRTQKLLKEACELWNGNSQTKDTLAETIELFDVSLAALRDGMPDAGVAPAPTPAIREKLDGIHTEWQEIKPVLVEASLPNETKTELYMRMNNALIETNSVVTLYSQHAKYEY